MNEPTPAQQDEIRALLAEGRKIEAIKRCRGCTGGGLKEAKEWVDAYHATLMKDQPELYQQKSGCLVLIVAVAGGCGVAAGAFSTWSAWA